MSVGVDAGSSLYKSGLGRGAHQVKRKERVTRVGRGRGSARPRDRRGTLASLTPAGPYKCPQMGPIVSY